MESMFFLVPVSIGLVALALWAFVWSVKNEQFEDLDKEAYSILFDTEDGKRQPEPAAKEKR